MIRRLRPGLVTPVPAARLGLVRVLIGGHTLRHLLSRRRQFRNIVRTKPELFAPVGPVRVLARPLPPVVADALNDATLVSAALFTLGIGGSVVARMHAALLTWTLAYRNSWSMVYHSENLLVLHTLALSAGRAADAVSIAAALRSEPAPAAHPRYGWPLHLMNGCTAAAYLLAGVAKVAGESGWAWASGDGLRRQVAIDGLRKEVFGSHASPLAYRLYPHRRLFTAMAVTSLVLELGAPLALVDRRLGRLWALGAFAMHWGILAVMGIRFRYQLTGVAFASWFDLERALRGMTS
ncbi:hypothetical protein ACQPZQ_23895 [Pseudonocardia sp. CA-142604]|uniref:hypothetical protein n=1 Tax=Pseudonocardia sp. CA-142604 TaxID=3240024 RepID=UPI003D8CCE3E